MIEPEVLRHVPKEGPYDFSKQLFPLLLEMGRPMYGHVCEGYWQDIGNLDQYRQANFDALDERVRLSIPGFKLRGNVWVGEGVEVDDVEGVEGPAFIGSDCRIAPDATVAAVLRALLGRHASRARARLAQRDRRRDVRRPQRDRRRARSAAGTATSARTRTCTRASRSATRSRSARSR